MCEKRAKYCRHGKRYKYETVWINFNKILYDNFDAGSHVVSNFQGRIFSYLLKINH